MNFPYQVYRLFKGVGYKLNQLIKERDREIICWRTQRVGSCYFYTSNFWHHLSSRGFQIPGNKEQRTIETSCPNEDSIYRSKNHTPILYLNWGQVILIDCKWNALNPISILKKGKHTHIHKGRSTSKMSENNRISCWLSTNYQFNNYLHKTKTQKAKQATG